MTFNSQRTAKMKIESQGTETRKTKTQIDENLVLPNE